MMTRYSHKSQRDFYVDLFDHYKYGLIQNYPNFSIFVLNADIVDKILITVEKVVP